MEPEEITKLMTNPSTTDKALISRAFNFAQTAHQGQKRFSGDPYFIHPLETAKILAELKADTPTIVAGLLHDTLEDTNITADDIKREFGSEIYFLVDGVTKLGELKYRGLKKHVESLRKLFIAMAKDTRVIIIRLADRLHNIKTLEYVPEPKRQRIAIETLEIYAPIANRLGIGKIKGLLEDGSFRFAYPKEYQQVLKLRKAKGRESTKRLEKISRTLQKELVAHGKKDYAIDYRIKFLYSLYNKLKRNDMDINKIYDLMALRVIVNSIDDCYQVLGIIHNLWRPVPGKLKDYISAPKPNGYQSIHTAVFTGDENIVEIQIRSQKMHEEAEYGVASHAVYKEIGKRRVSNQAKKKVAWIKNLIDWQKETSESEEFLSVLKTDFFKDQIFTFTPKGDVVELPVGATALDFAYAIHSDVGHQAVGATVNGKYVALSTPLTTNDIVKIETKKNTKPNVKWLKFTQTQAARKHIKSWLQKKKEIK